MLSTEDFAKFAKTSVVPFLHVTTRLPGRVHDGLLREFGGRGFPTLLVLNAEGEIVGRPRKRTVEAFRTAVGNARRTMAESERPDEDKTDADRVTEYLRNRELRGNVSPQQQREDFLKVRALLSKEQRESIQKDISSAEIMSIVSGLNLVGLTAEQVREPANEAKLFGLLAAKERMGSWPTGGVSNRALIALIAWADARKDPALFRKWLEDLAEARAGVLGGNEQFLAWFEQRLEQLETGKAEGDFMESFLNRRGVRRAGGRPPAPAPKRRR